MNIEFIKSDFKGVLPGQYGRAGQRFNDRNREETDKYAKSVEEDCTFRIDSYDKREFMAIPRDRKLFCRPIVDLANSKFPFRSFYFFPINIELGAWYVPQFVRSLHEKFLSRFVALRYYCLTGVHGMPASMGDRYSDGANSNSSGGGGGNGKVRAKGAGGGGGTKRKKKTKTAKKAKVMGDDEEDDEL